ncbi:DGQHR domain-containing protein [Reichenbachiella sp.]
MRAFNELTGNPLELWFQELFTTELGFEDYFSSPGQIPLTHLNPELEVGHHLEIDGLLRIHKTCILFEYTGQGGSFRDKIKKFNRSVHLFVEDEHLNLRDKLSLFNVPENKLDDFDEIEEWKFVYFGTHPDFDLRNYRRTDFPDYPFVRDRLYIFQPTQLEYIRQLTNLIGKYGKNELLATLEFTPVHMGEPDENLRLDFIKADKKYVVGNSETKADIYLIKFKIDQLLKMARVSRYEGLPFVLESSDTSDNYQRLLEDEKLKSIAEKFINNNKKKTFPNTITLALSSECEEVRGTQKLSIPKKYSSIDIIDGQHRLFGYTRQEVDQLVRQDAEILATALKFDTTDQKVITKNAARVFCEINSTQAKVKKDLLYLIKYDVLEERNHIAAAGKIVLECDRRDGVLAGMFRITSLRRRNRLNYPCISVVDIIEKEISVILTGDGTNDTKASGDHLKLIFNTEADFSTSPDDYIKGAIILLERYFSHIKSVFSKDWEKDAETHLLTEPYILALIRLLRYRLFNMNETMDDIHDTLLALKTNIDHMTNPNSSPSFPVNSDQIPEPSESHIVISDFLIDLGNKKLPSND